MKQLLKKLKKLLAGMWFTKSSAGAGKRTITRTKTYARRSQPGAARGEAPAAKPKRKASAPARRRRQAKD